VVANKVKVIAVVGPTCTGKSDLALWLASHTKGEIVNADSMQAYRRFDIGSAKPDRLTREETPHHLIDIVEPDEEFNAALFQSTADGVIHEIDGRQRVPIVVGGTGLYLRVLFHGLFEVPTDRELRERLRKRYDEGPLEVYEELKGYDRQYALAISHRDKVRVVRALEIYLLSGVTMSEWQRRHGFQEERYDTFKIGLYRERQELYGRINRRVEGMLEQGWIGEVEGLLKAGYDPGLKPFQSIGYREILLHLKGAMTYPDMVEQIKRATRRYSKRQFTWFSKEKKLHWYRYPEERESILEEAQRFLD